MIQPFLSLAEAVLPSVDGAGECKPLRESGRCWTFERQSLWLSKLGAGSRSMDGHVIATVTYDCLKVLHWYKHHPSPSPFLQAVKSETGELGAGDAPEMVTQLQLTLLKGRGIDISWPEMPVTVEPTSTGCECGARHRLVSFQGSWWSRAGPGTRGIPVLSLLSL